ncbi:transducin beta-like protein 2 [Gordionus sp. m RMFG-2023]|uniref:transducin beta-like protein 2 n=1 Tax=Gordionus sp. m RMFG-2023 TaxID=3053472 RepID=UPI0031FD784C
MSEGSLSPLRLNLEPDYCDIIRFSPDNKAFISHLAESNILRVFAISKKQSPKSYKHFDLPKLYSKKMIGFEVANCGVYILSYYRDCTIIITNVKGLELYRLNTEQLSLNECILSPCSRLFATRGATKGIKLWKLINYSMDQIDKIENFADLSRDQMVKSFAFSFDSSKIAFVNGGNSWKICELLDITTGKIKSEPNVIIDSFLTLKGLDTDSHTNKPKSRDKKIIKSNPKYVSQAKGKRQLESENEEENEEITNGKTVLVALAEECNCLALLSHEENGGKNLSLYNILNVMVIDTIFEGVKEDGLFKMCFYDNDKYLLIGHKSDKRIYVFHNVSSYKLKIDKLSFKKKSNPNDITGNKKLEEEISKMESLIKRLSSGK